ncbi:MAG TPA: pyridoxamine 5'-phosphate oxidase family protein [Candidatus Faecivivens stercoripullorum]|uniref:Pyridoxamine 5'-phosphate oxidase family protein n=1 Tax=Candidatus Faecivivens stercoripullorum TaxID=2840805 RepID=A0A9D1H5A1_9FIRM|nr:pyridoxamine 5'-phosphate oxidase family protein [Candidatus Faecivivens stercoripullorum]
MMIDVVQFIKEAGMFFLATSENGQPKQRPFGGVMLLNDRIYFDTNTEKSVYKQMTANPQVSLCAFSKGCWMRIEGRAVPDHSPETLDAITERNPMLKKLREKEGDIFTSLYLEDATVEFHSGEKCESWKL